MQALAAAGDRERVEAQVLEQLLRALRDLDALGESGAVGLGKVSAAGQPFEADVKKIQDQITAGEITDIPNEVGK